MINQRDRLHPGIFPVRAPVLGTGFFLNAEGARVGVVMDEDEKPVETTVVGWVRNTLERIVQSKKPRTKPAFQTKALAKRAQNKANKKMSRDAFPQTLNPTWWDVRLDGGDEASMRELRNHIMTIYAEPLKAYFLGSSFREMGEADDIVQGFFSDRLARPDYLRQWRASGKKLRRWLMNGLCFYLRECITKENQRSATGTRVTAEMAGTDETQSKAMDLAFLRSVVQNALKAAGTECGARGLQDHWDYFCAYHLHGRACDDLAAENGLDRDRMWVMIRTGQRRFARAVRDHLAEDGARAEDIDDEIQSLLDLSNT